jgi:outer membrane lipoprotein-sorting protein
MKKYVFLFSLMFYLYGLFSQVQTKKIQDDESVIILQSIQKKLKTLKTAEIKFNFRSEKENKTLKTLQGHIWIKGKNIN